ncbi:MAG: RecX family transcriptional regulator [Novosphingobium sp.]|nr:RecX family transcriptional regulator [Novosphingobium sp.]
MRARRPPVPLDRQRLEELALAYVARFATSAAKLGRYLRRKLRERGWEGAGEPDPDALVARFVAAGYVDDAGFARARASGLRRRGYGERRVEQALREAGVGEAERADARASEAQARRAALVLARKRGFGPFGASGAGRARPDRARREKQLAAMLRAGHRLDTARNLLDAPSEAEALEWVDEAAGDDSA